MVAGNRDYWSDPRPKKLVAAMTALAEFHRATKTFAVARLSTDQTSLAVSRSLAERLELVHRLMAGGLAELQSAVERNRELMPRAAALSQCLFPRIAPQLSTLERQLRDAAQIKSPLQPCLRDIWHDHVLFDADRVSGIVDTGSMRMETIAGDISRLLGSLCSNDPEGWSLGLTAYQQVLPIPDGTRTLVSAFDRSQVLLAGVKWVEWVFVERRSFADPFAVEKRMEHILARLQTRRWNRSMVCSSLEGKMAAAASCMRWLNRKKTDTLTGFRSTPPSVRLAHGLRGDRYAWIRTASFACFGLASLMLAGPSLRPASGQLAPIDPLRQRQWLC